MILSLNHSGQTIPKETDLIGISRHASLIMNAKTDGRYYWKGMGSLSFKFAMQGESRYKLSSRYLLCDRANFVVLNQAQPYEIFIESKIVTETFCVFFGQPLVNDVLLNGVSSHEQILDSEITSQTSTFLEGTHSMNPKISRHLRLLKSAMLNFNDTESIKELLHLFLSDLIATERKRATQSEALQSVKKSTREELLKRLVIAKDYAHAMYSQPIALEELGKVACLSPNHLLRSFRQLYGCSPIQYLNGVRLQKAKMLLKQSTFSIQEVCSRVGYNSLGTFSNTFKKSTGVAPSEFRLRKGDFE